MIPILAFVTVAAAGLFFAALAGVALMAPATAGLARMRGVPSAGS